MTRLYWYLRGYVQFVFTGGFAEDFINALGKLGITLPGLQRQGSDLRGVCSVGTYMQLHKAARQAGGRVRITVRRGLPFFLRRLRGRWGLPMGAVAFALVLCVLSGFIWDVQVVGNNRVGTGTLETYLAQNGVAVGKPWQGAARSRLNYRLLGDFPDLAWAHINKVGATARLEVAERVDTPKTKSDREQSQWGAARRELRCTVRRLQVHRVQTGRQVCRGVYFYGLTLVPMGKDAPPMTEVTEQRRLLRLNGRALPMGSVTRTRTAYRRVEQRLTVQAATALGYTTVQSPITGYISASNADIGTLVGPGGKSLLATIVKSDTVRVDFSMTGMDYLRSKERNVNLGQKDSTRRWNPYITVTLPDNSRYPLRGLVDFADPQVDPETGTFSVRAEMPNPDHILLPGQFTKVKLLLDVRENAVVVPSKAIVIEKGGAYIFVVRPDSVVEKRFIETGPELDNKTVVERGLLSGERIVVEGYHKLNHGMRVEAVEPWRDNGVASN